MSPARAGFWAARLTDAVGPERLVHIESPRSQRLEIYCPTAAEARELAGRFGGRTRELPDAAWQTPAPAATAARPLAIGRRLLVTGRAEALSDLRAAHPGRGVLAVPAAMAFGTGEHATTAMCLRLLEEIARPPALAPGAWELLDLGAGSGILALAGRLLGARAAFGLDNDPHAVRTARENAALNAVRAVRFTRADLLAWTPTRTWPVVTANLFSELLIRLLPTAIAPALAPSGRLIASGVLGTQAAEVEAAFGRAGLELLETRRRGRWRAFLCRR